MSGRKEDAPHQKAATTSSIWATTKLFERSLRQGSSWVGQKVGLTTRVEDDANVDVKVHEFEQLKSTQKQIARLLHKYVEEQRAVKDTERALGMMLSEIGARETRPNMSRCLTDAGRILSQTTVRREGALEASEDFLKQVELFLDTAVRDVKDSLVRYDSTRRASSAAIETLAASRSAQQDPERRQMLQGEVDATGDKYRLASWQLSQKTLILTLHRNQALCDRTSKLMTQWAEEHTSCAELFSAWPGFVADEHDQMSVIQECYESPAPIVPRRSSMDSSDAAAQGAPAAVPDPLGRLRGEAAASPLAREASEAEGWSAVDLQGQAPYTPQGQTPLQGSRQSSYIPTEGETLYAGRLQPDGLARRGEAVLPREMQLNLTVATPPPARAIPTTPPPPPDASPSTRPHVTSASASETSVITPGTPPRRAQPAVPAAAQGGVPRASAQGHLDHVRGGGSGHSGDVAAEEVSGDVPVGGGESEQGGEQEEEPEEEEQQQGQEQQGLAEEEEEEEEEQQQQQQDAEQQDGLEQQPRVEDGQQQQEQGQDEEENAQEHGAEEDTAMQRESGEDGNAAEGEEDGAAKEAASARHT